MNHRFSNPWIRILAFLLAVLCLAGAFYCGISAVNCLERGFLRGDSVVYQESRQCAERVRLQGREVISQFQRNPQFQYWDKMLENTNLRFIILEEQTGDVVASYLKGLELENHVPNNLADNIFMNRYDSTLRKGEYGTELEPYYVCDYYFGEDWTGDSSWQQLQEQNWPDPVDETPVIETTEQTATYQILYLLDDVDAYLGDSIGNGYRLFLYFRNQSEKVVSAGALCALCLLALVIYLLATAGRRPGKDEDCLTWFDRIPTDLMLLVGLAAGVGLFGLGIWFCEELSYDYGLTLLKLARIQTAAVVGVAVCGGLGLLILCSFSARIKAGKFWQSALTFRACRWCWRQICRVFGRMGRAVLLGLRSIGMVPRAVLAFLLVMLVEFLLLVWLVNVYNPALPLMALIVFNFGLLGALFWAVAQMKILQNAAKTLAEGGLDQHVELGQMYWDFKTHGEHLNAIADGMNKAVEQRMKSERLKTELITNVSHDIKTPLTSIINYVDLLQKPHTEAEGIQYLEVLDRQSKRLKKLTENLVEASKASTGNLPVELQPTNVLELLNQAVEEYRDRLEAGNLEIVMGLRGDLTVQADGKHMWRILDNLLNNVVKYALSGTRVYITAEKRDRWVVMAVKNISRDPLNVDADELMERFVRGDSSRTTEGSGLGLNIARSLTVLQNGRFDLTVDGDFFKAEISLPAV